MKLLQFAEYLNRYLTQGYGDAEVSVLQADGSTIHVDKPIAMRTYAKDDPDHLLREEVLLTLVRPPELIGLAYRAEPCNADQAAETVIVLPTSGGATDGSAWSCGALTPEEAEREMELLDDKHPITRYPRMA